jgi:predicted site-specific integrase-resolvase
MSTISAELAERVLGIKPATLRKWVERGHVRKVGRALYDLDDVRARWLKMGDSDLTD